MPTMKDYFQKWMGHPIISELAECGCETLERPTELAQAPIYTPPDQVQLGTLKVYDRFVTPGQTLVRQIAAFVKSTGDPTQSYAETVADNGNKDNFPLALLVIKVGRHIPTEVVSAGDLEIGDRFVMEGQTRIREVLSKTRYIVSSRDIISKVVDEIHKEDKVIIVGEKTGEDACDQFDPEVSSMMKDVAWTSFKKGVEFGAPILSNYHLGEVESGDFKEEITVTPEGDVKTEVKGSRRVTIHRKEDNIIGTYHTHLSNEGSTVPSDFDMLDMLKHNDKIQCIGSYGFPGHKIACYTPIEPGFSKIRAELEDLLRDINTFNDDVGKKYHITGSRLKRLLRSINNSAYLTDAATITQDQIDAANVRVLELDTRAKEVVEIYNQAEILVADKQNEVNIAKQQLVGMENGAAQNCEILYSFESLSDRVADINNVGDLEALKFELLRCKDAYEIGLNAEERDSLDTIMETREVEIDDREKMYDRTWEAMHKNIGSIRARKTAARREAAEKREQKYPPFGEISDLLDQVDRLTARIVQLKLIQRKVLEEQAHARKSGSRVFNNHYFPGVEALKRGIASGDERLAQLMKDAAIKKDYAEFARGDADYALAQWVAMKGVPLEEYNYAVYLTQRGNDIEGRRSALIRKLKTFERQAALPEDMMNQATGILKPCHLIWEQETLDRDELELLPTSQLGGRMVDLEKASGGKCKCTAGKELCWKPGIGGTLSTEQKELYCKEWEPIHTGG